jgi:hypothetical protein
MKRFRLSLTLLALALTGLVSAPVLGQSVMSISPNSVTPGVTKDVVVRTIGTHFKDGVTTADFGPGITVKGGLLKVNNQELGMATIMVDKNAAPGPRKITLTTGTEVVTDETLFEVLPEGGNMRAVIDVIPNPSISLADFDTKNPAGSPLLFTITIYNDAIEKANLRGVLTITGDVYGKVALGTKYIPSLKANEVYPPFSNKAFDKYEVDRSNEAFFQAAISTGLLPSDIYTYRFDLFNEENKILLTIEDKNIVENVIARPELIYPGSEFSSKPEPMEQKYPLFQWFSQATEFDIAVYPVNDFQKSPEEVVLNRPVYQQKGLKKSGFMYPSSAEALKEGQVYAWQVTAYQQTSKGKQALKSNVLWFNVSSPTQPDNGITSIEISPSDLNIEAKNSQKFTAKALNEEGKEVAFSPEWRVIPSNMGTIDQNGLFVANTIPGAAAILVKYGGMEEYVTIEVISQSAGGFMMDGFLKELFGLPE